MPHLKGIERILDDSVKSSLADFRADNPGPRPTQDQDSRVIDKGDTQVIRIPNFKCKFCGKTFKEKHNLSTHIKLRYATAIAVARDRNHLASPILGIQITDVRSVTNNAENVDNPLVTSINAHQTSALC